MFFNILDHGALGNGRTPDTAALQAAIDTAHAAGGSLVVIPPGRYPTGALHLRDRVTLDLQPGAVLLGLPDPAGVPLIAARGASGIGLAGRGGIEASASGGSLVELVACNDVEVSAIHLANATGRALRLVDCDRVRVRGLSVRGAFSEACAAGVELAGCRDVTLCECRVETGGDAVVVAGSDAFAERVVVSHCLLQARRAAFRLEAEGRRGGVRQVLLNGNLATRCQAGVALSAIGGATIEDVRVEHLMFDSLGASPCARPIDLALRHGRRGAAPGAIRHIVIGNVSARTSGRILLTAEPGLRLEHIVLRDIHLVYPEIDDPRPGAAGLGSGRREGRPAPVLGACAAIVADNVDRLAVENLSVSWPGPRMERKAKGRAVSAGEAVAGPTAGPPAFGVLWGRNLEGGHLRAPLAGASAPDAARVCVTGGSFREAE